METYLSPESQPQTWTCPRETGNLKAKPVQKERSDVDAPPCPAPAKLIASHPSQWGRKDKTASSQRKVQQRAQVLMSQPCEGMSLHTNSSLSFGKKKKKKGKKSIFCTYMLHRRK